jgi:predicted small lipoprotein YifL
MPKRVMLVPVLLALLLSACGQKGPLYIPPEQQGPAAGPIEGGGAGAEDIDEEMEDVERPPAQTQDAQTLEAEEEEL